ncbi:hypothetical protein D9M72_538640 [compost metagenome]
MCGCRAGSAAMADVVRWPGHPNKNYSHCMTTVHQWLRSGLLHQLKLVAGGVAQCGEDAAPGLRLGEAAEGDAE